MPRPNQPRSIASETSLARRIEHERSARAMSFEALAIQMKHVGCPINASALFRIERGVPPRRITVDELTAFSTVFGIPIEELLLPPEVAASKEVGGLINEWHNKDQAALVAEASADDAWQRLVRYVQEHPVLSNTLGPMLWEWSIGHFEGTRDDHMFRVSRQMWQLTKDPAWLERSNAALKKMMEEDNT